MTAPRTALRIALVGLMGSGKSRVGSLLAAAAGWPFLDADRLLEGEAGLSVSEIFAREGEAGFRDRESRLLETLARRPPPFVLATGGGVVERDENRTLLRLDFHTIWLRIDPEEAVRRVGRSRSRPLLAGGDARHALLDLAQRRTPLYREVARMEAETGSATRAEDLRDAILESLGAG